MPTKYYDDHTRKTKPDTPIAISGEKLTKSDKPSYYCNYCQYKMVKISEEEWHCNHCNNSAYPQVEQLRSKSKITTPIGMNLEPCLSYAPEPNDLSKPEVEIKGGLKTLKDRGIKITSYKEGVG